MSHKKAIVFPYVPNSVPTVKAEMLKEVDAADEMELYSEIPDHLRLGRKLRLPRPILDEYEIKRHVEGLLAKNINCKENLNFLGAGCAQHFVPAVCDEINGRGEFLTAYVGESYADHGKWQALFEYCSLMGELLDMDVLSCPLYDGGQAAASSIRMASRLTGRTEVVVPRSMNPEVRSLLGNYLKPDISISEVSFDQRTGTMDMDDLGSKVTSRTAAVFIENPNYLGIIENEALKIGELAREKGAEFVVSCDPISLGIIAPPAQYGATIACGDFHPLGIPMVAGGGQGGFIATHDDMRYIREFKDLMYGLTETATPGEYGFGEVLFERTSYGSRERGKEFTGTSTGIWAITAAVYLSLMGPTGMAETGQTIKETSQYAAKQAARVKGVRLRFKGQFFKEFVLDFNGTGKSVKKINQALLRRGIIGGKDLSKDFPQLGQSALYCVTETKTIGDIQRLVDGLREAV
jgi:glycine dehydrogenase subunit 1